MNDTDTWMFDDQSWWKDDNGNNLTEIILDNPGEMDINQPENMLAEPGSDQITRIFPENIPILPLRGLVAYPQTIIPLTIGQPRSIQLVDEVAETNRYFGLVTAQDPDIENPNPSQLFKIGTLATINRIFRAPDGTIRLLVQGIARFRISEFTQSEPFLRANIINHPEAVEKGLEVDALSRNVRDQFDRIANLIPSIPRELVTSVNGLQDPLQTAYTVANLQRMKLADAQNILELDSTTEKLRLLVAILTRESEVLELGKKIQDKARDEIEKMQREYFLREQMKAIQHELGEGDEQTVEIEDFKKRIEAAHMPEEAEKQAHRELDRLSRLPSAAAEYGVIRTYLGWLVALPWNTSTEDNLEIAHARQILDQDHYGLSEIKERILEFLAVRRMRNQRATEITAEVPQDIIRRTREGVILCFIGPPGVGKTSLGQSIARALGRKFIRISLGGMRDEAEIRGHRRTYIGAMPGRILNALRRVESRNPVFMLDEIDKLTADFNGDPASALLEVLDPEQNIEFRDNYLEVPFDLSQVMFITTANQVETIPLPLLDRMEVIRLSGYTEREKTTIARKYLIPRQIRENGLHPDEVNLSAEVIATIIRQYTREAGVRNLEREIAAICRKVVVNISEGKSDQGVLDQERVHKMLGRPLFFENAEVVRRTTIPGVATGLAWTPAGGEILFIEATRMAGSKGYLITGSVGNVMQESAQAALSYVRSHAEELGIEATIFERSDIHLHIPSGAQPKDGPSAGVTITTALVSLFTNRIVRSDLGMTGEITLRGQVMPVGGIKDKLLAAHRAGLKVIILPKENELDLDDLPEDVRKNMQFILAESIDDVLCNAFEDPVDSTRKI